MKRSETEYNFCPLPYIIGFILNVVCFFIGSNFLIRIFSNFFLLESEYKSYIIWSVSGLILSCIGNIFGILVIAPQNFVKTIIGSFIGLTIGIAFSFIPKLHIAGIVTIFIGSLLGHYKL